MFTLTYYNRSTKKHFKINLNKLFVSLLTAIIIISCVILCVDFCRFPEKHLPTQKYHLFIDIQNGNQDSINYYNEHYVSEGIYLFGEDENENNDFLNLATVTSYEASEHGVLLHTADGNGYFIEK